MSKVSANMDQEKIADLAEFYGLRGRTLKWIKSFLLDSMQVMLDDHLSSEAKVPSGVPQGRVLGPLQKQQQKQQHLSILQCPKYVLKFPLLK